MLAADADAPTGNHHVFAMKKYVLTKVISQMMISRTRPMDHDLPTWIRGLPHRDLLEITEIENWESKPGRIYHSFFRAQAGSCILFFLAPSFTSGGAENISPENRNHALTNFFDLSNIRFVSGGSSEMLRTSRCLRTIVFQSDGPRTLRTVAFFFYSISRHPKKSSCGHGKLKVVLNDSRVTGRPARRRARRIGGRPGSGPQIMLAAGELVLETIWSSGPISFRPRTSRARLPHNLKGEGAAHFVPAK